MVFNPNKPQPTDLLEDSQGDLLSNNQDLDTTFGINHYKFSNLTANNGFHNIVTTPEFYANPEIAPVLPSVLPVTVTNPVFYGYQPLDAGGLPITNLGLLQYSRGPNNAVPTPVTFLSSTLAPLDFKLAGASANILDFTGISVALGRLVAANYRTPPFLVDTLVFWNAAFGFKNIVNPGTGQFTASFVFNTLTISNSTANANMDQIRWTFQLLRVE